MKGNEKIRDSGHKDLRSAENPTITRVHEFFI